MALFSPIIAAPSMEPSVHEAVRNGSALKALAYTTPVTRGPMIANTLMDSIINMLGGVTEEQKAAQRRSLGIVEGSPGQYDVNPHLGPLQGKATPAPIADSTPAPTPASSATQSTIAPSGPVPEDQSKFQEPDYEFPQAGPQGVKPKSAPGGDTLAEILQMLGHEHTPVPHETMGADESAQLAGLVKPKVAAGPDTGNVPGVSGFQRFIAAGSGPFDWHRADRQALELAAQKQKLLEQQQEYTPQEKEQLALLANKKERGEAFNREADLEHLRQGGIDPQSKFMLNLLGHRYGQETEHGMHMEELATSRVLPTRTPEELKSELQKEVFARYLDALSPEDIQSATGLKVDPNILAAITAARARSDDPTKDIIAQFLAQKLGVQGGAAQSPTVGGRSVTPTTKVAPGKPSTTNLNLNALRTPGR